MVNGEPLRANHRAALSGAVEVLAPGPANATHPTSMQLTTPLMLVKVVQRKPSKPHQMKDPLYGQFLDTYITLRAPLPLPVGGLLASSYRAPTAHAAAAVAAGQVMAASDSGLLTASITYGDS